MAKLESNSSRFRLRDLAKNKPGYCIACGSAKKGAKYFDVMRDEDLARHPGVSTIYVCTYCVSEMAILLGFVTGEKFAEAMNELNEVKKERDTDDGIRNVLDALGSIVDDYRNGTITSPALVIASEPEPETIISSS